MRPVTARLLTLQREDAKLSASATRRELVLERDTAFARPSQSRLSVLTALHSAEGSDSSGVSPVSVPGFQSDRAAEGTLGSPSGHGGDAPVPPGRLGCLA